MIAAEAGCRFGTIDGQVLSPAEIVAQTPVPAPPSSPRPRRLEFLMKSARMLEC